MVEIRFYFNDVKYEGKSEYSNIYEVCCDVLKQNNISFTDDDTFDVEFWARHRTYVDLTEETA